MTSLNQANHCVLVRPPAAAPPELVPTVAIPNQMLDTAGCNRIAANAGFGQHAAGAVSTHAADFGGALPSNAFTAAEVAGLQGGSTTSLAGSNATHVAATKADGDEAAGLSARRGADYRRPSNCARKRMRACRRAGCSRSAGDAAHRDAVGDREGIGVGGRLANDRGGGQPGYVVELVREDGTRVDVIGRTYSAEYFQKLFLRAIEGVRRVEAA